MGFNVLAERHLAATDRPYTDLKWMKVNGGAYALLSTEPHIAIFRSDW